MVGSNYSITHGCDYTTLSTNIKGSLIPLVSSTDRLQVESIYHNILTGVYKNALELCEDIQSSFSLQATMLVLVTLQSTEPIKNKYVINKTK